MGVLSSYPGPIIEEVGSELADAPAIYFAVSKAVAKRRLRGKQPAAALYGRRG